VRLREALVGAARRLEEPGEPRGVEGPGQAAPRLAGGDRQAYLLLCPNLTIVALGASTLLESQRSPQAAGWLLLTGFFLTVFAIALLPAASNKLETQRLRAGPDQPAEPTPEAGVP